MITIELENFLEYFETLLECVEKCSEDSISYIFDLISFGLDHVLKYYDSSVNIVENLINILNNIKNVGLNVIIAQRENLNYLNVKSLLKIFIKGRLLENENYKKNILSKFITSLTELNEKRIWLLIKILMEEFMQIFLKENKNMSLLSGLEENIMDLSEVKETRGDDSFMIKVIPNFLYSPFNLNSIMPKFEKFNNLSDENISKFGIYIRWAISKLFENMIENLGEKINNINKLSFSKNENLFSDLEFLAGLIHKILLVIDKSSSGKAEMQFTTKHRRKLRLSQFLVILSKVFLYVNTALESLISNEEINQKKCSIKEIIKNIEKINKKIFEKINLYSVKFYLDLFSLNLCYLSETFFDYLLENLRNPQSKTHCVSSSMIIMGILFINLIKSGNKIFLKEKFNKFFEVLVSLCTSNICNIRGFAQFFLFKFSEMIEQKQFILDYISSSFSFSKVFINYLKNNTNIQKFFKKFDESFIKFTDIFENYSFENVLSKNFDEINCEIIPIDILNEFKELGMKMVKLENEDFTKPNISWKWGLCPELMESVIQSEKLGSKKTKKLNLECQETIKEILVNENQILKNNYFEIKKKNIENQTDFQKKYRPGLTAKCNETSGKDINNPCNEDNKNEFDQHNELEKPTKLRKRLDIVVMASLIDKAPNLGGLARTCEVFNLGCMTIASEAYLNDNGFLTAAVSAEKWLPLVNLPICDVEIFLISYKKLGYKIIGLEQTANSINLRQFKFTEKIVVVLGNEKEGIPQNIINLIDYCVIIPQFGEIRSLNVHVSAALMLWEIVNSINK